MSRQINVIFSGPPGGTKPPELIGVEDEEDHNSETATWIERPDGSWALQVMLGVPQLTNYTTHAAVLTQATAFLTQMTQTAVLYVTVTGGAWAVVSSNTIGANTTTLLSILGLHVALSVGTSLGLYGLGNNFIQRLNLAQLLGAKYWPSIDDMGRQAWNGPQSKTSSPDWIPRTLHPLDSWARYTASEWPSLRHQRLWFVLPLLAAAVSFKLGRDIWDEHGKRNDICARASNTLSSFPDAVPIDRLRLAFERARYVFDKAGCEVTRLNPNQIGSDNVKTSLGSNWP